MTAARVQRWLVRYRTSLDMCVACAGSRPCASCQPRLRARLVPTAALMARKRAKRELRVHLTERWVGVLPHHHVLAAGAKHFYALLTLTDAVRLDMALCGHLEKKTQQQ